MISTLKITSPGRNFETLDSLEIVEKCLNIWGNFLLSKSKEIPTMPEEVIYNNFEQWKPHNS